MIRDEDLFLTDEEFHYSSKAEISEWIDVNRQLRKHGFQAVHILPASDVQISTGRYLCLDPESSKTLRHNTMSLLADYAHHQSLTQDLMETNNLLKIEMSGLKENTDKLQEKMKELKIMLKCSRSRVQELEKERHSSSVQAEDSEKGRNVRNVIQQRCSQLEGAFAEKEIEIEHLRKKLRIFRDEDEKRIRRQNQVFQEFKKRTAQAHSVMDAKLLDIIDLYETQIYELQQKLEGAKQEDPRIQTRDGGSSFVSRLAFEPTRNIKHVIKGLEKQLHEADKKNKALEEEKELMALEMDSRPQVKDYHLAIQRVKKLERLLALHNISIPGEKNKRDLFHNKHNFSTHLEDLDHLPVDFCQQYLRDICSELEVEDIEKVVPQIHDLKSHLNTARKYKEFCIGIQQTVHHMEDPVHANHRRLRNEAAEPRNLLGENNVRHTMEVIENWRRDMMSLQKLQTAINQLLEHLLPRARIHLTSNHTVADMAEILLSLADDETTTVTQGGYEHVSRSLLESIVHHFQTLFDVSSISGILPRMTDVYRRLGEAQNVQSTLRNLLGLPADVSSSSVVDAVGRLCQSLNSTTSKQLQHLFQTDDLSSVIRRLDEHTEFLPAFKEIMKKLLEILGVERMDQVIPAVRALKLLAS